MCGVTHPDTYQGSDGVRRLRSDSFIICWSCSLPISMHISPLLRILFLKGVSCLPGAKCKQPTTTTTRICACKAYSGVCVCVCDAVHAPGSRLRWGLLLRAGSLSRRHLLENSSFCVTPSRGGVRVHFPVAGAAVLGVSLIRLDRFVYVRVCTVTLHPLLSITPMAGSACSLFL